MCVTPNWHIKKEQHNQNATNGHLILNGQLPVGLRGWVQETFSASGPGTLFHLYACVLASSQTVSYRKLLFGALKGKTALPPKALPRGSLCGFFCGQALSGLPTVNPHLGPAWADHKGPHVGKTAAGPVQVNQKGPCMGKTVPPFVQISYSAKLFELD